MQAITDGIRQRKTVTKAITELDAFPKVPESYQESSTSGGTVSILTFLFITVLVFSEFLYYFKTVSTYNYEVDVNADHKIRINVDITVAMECDDLGADVLDVSGSSIDTSEDLFTEPTYFAMSSKQFEWWKAFRSIRKSNEGYRSINDVTDMYSIFGRIFATAMPKKQVDEFQGKDFDACRIHGNIEVNKVAGNFHITAGKSIPHPRGHAHLSSLVSELNYNFSHRIDLLSFGDPHPGIINPMDGDLEITEAAYHMYQYYIKIVPTNIQGVRRKIRANQYSVTQRSRAIHHGSGSHGVPGVFFKYDLHPICVNVVESYGDFTQLLIRLCGIIGGVFATSGMIHSLVGFLSNSIMCQMSKGNKEKNIGSSQQPLNQINSSQTTNSNNTVVNNKVVTSANQPILVTPAVSLVPPQQNNVA